MDSEKTAEQYMIFTARQLKAKCQEQNMDLYMTFVDLAKAFNTVSRDGLWKIMVKGMVRQFHDGVQARAEMMESTLNHFR